MLDKVADQARRAAGAATGREERPEIDVSGVAEGAGHGQGTQGSDTVFELEDLSVSYDGKPAVKDVSMDIHENEITALIGPSGLRQEHPDPLLQPDERPDPRGDGRGPCYYHGQDLYGSEVDPVEVRKRIGMVFQKPNPFPKSIFDNIAFGPRVLGLRTSRSGSRRPCARRPSGTRSRTASTRTPTGCPAASSSASASRAASRSTPT